MPGHQFNSKIYEVPVLYSGGQAGWKESAVSTQPCQGGSFRVVTGGANGLLSDFSAAATTPLVLIPDSQVPANMRCYVTNFELDVRGDLNWGVTSPTAGSVGGVRLEDTTGVPNVIAPYAALLGGASFRLPATEIRVPLLLGPNTVNSTVGTPIDTFTYVQGTGVITTAANEFVANYGIGGLAYVRGGTGKGQCAIVTAVTANTVTVSPPFTGLDATSVIALDYQSLSAYTDTTHVTLQNGGATPYTAALLQLRYSIYSVLGTGVGQGSRIATGSTAGALTLLDTLQTAWAQATTLVEVTNRPDMRGVIDCCMAQQYPCNTIGKGLQLNAYAYTGTAPVGSDIRVIVEGYFGT